MKAPIKKHVASANAEPVIKREAATKPAKERGRSVDKADPYPGLGRRALFREMRREGESF